MVPKDSKELGWMAGIALPVQWEEGGDGDEAAKEKEEQVIKGYSQHALSISHEWCASLKHIVHEFPTQLHPIELLSSFDPQRKRGTVTYTTCPK